MLNIKLADYSIRNETMDEVLVLFNTVSDGLKMLSQTALKDPKVTIIKKIGFVFKIVIAFLKIGIHFAIADPRICLRRTPSIVALVQSIVRGTSVWQNRVSGIRAQRRSVGFQLLPHLCD
jgi:hypothetical protein